MVQAEPVAIAIWLNCIPMYHKGEEHYKTVFEMEEEEYTNSDKHLLL